TPDARSGSKNASTRTGANPFDAADTGTPSQASPLESRLGRVRAGLPRRGPVPAPRPAPLPLYVVGPRVLGLESRLAARDVHLRSEKRLARRPHGVLRAAVPVARRDRWPRGHPRDAPVTSRVGVT